MESSRVQYALISGPLSQQTSSRNRGLSGKTKYIIAPINEGSADTAMKILQLWNLNPPRGTSMFPWGMIAQANAAHRKRPTIQNMAWTPR